MAGILAVGSPLAYLVAATHPYSSAAAVSDDVLTHVQNADRPVNRPAPVRKKNPGTGDFIALGTVTAFNTVNVRSRVDGQLMSVSFKEGELVPAGQLLASIDPRPFQIQLSQAEGQLAQDQAQIAISRVQQTLIATFAPLEGKVKSDQALVDSAKLQLTYAQVTAPISGVAGLRLVDPGNIVHAADAGGILVITQVRPIAVVFTIAEDLLPGIRSRLRDGPNFLVEVRDRNNTVTIANGRVTAVDNQIDVTTGTGKVKAVFENEDGALFPNQFVNVRLPEYHR
jgi:multidrug efflux system membrane fusion protein